MELVTTEIDGIYQRDIARNEPRMIIEITTETVGGISVGGQHVDSPYPRPGTKAEPFTTQLVIYRSQWPAVQKMVRTDAHMQALERSRARNARDREASVRGLSDADRARKLAEWEDQTFVHLHQDPGCEGGIPVLTVK